MLWVPTWIASTWIQMSTHNMLYKENKNKKYKKHCKRIIRQEGHDGPVALTWAS